MRSGASCNDCEGIQCGGVFAARGLGMIIVASGAGWEGDGLTLTCVKGLVV